MQLTKLNILPRNSNKGCWDVSYTFASFIFNRLNTLKIIPTFMKQCLKILNHKNRNYIVYSSVT